MRLHQIERHAVQLTLEDALRLVAEAEEEGAVDSISDASPALVGR
jgi:hypothetical protein